MHRPRVERGESGCGRYHDYLLTLHFVDLDLLYKGDSEWNKDITLSHITRQRFAFFSPGLDVVQLAVLGLEDLCDMTVDGISARISKI